MAYLLSDILPLAVGMAVFPIPIVTVIMLLFSSNGRANGLGFVAGWILGVAVPLSGVALVADGAGADTDPGTYAIASWINLLLGAGLLFLAFRQWQRRPAPGQEPEMPRWMKSIYGFTPRKAFKTALLLTAVNPKNLALAAAAGGTIGKFGLPAAETIVAVLVFTAVASVTVAAPVLYYLGGGERAKRVMKDIERWLIRRSGALMAVILLVLGTVLMSHAVRDLLDEQPIDEGVTRAEDGPHFTERE